MAKVFVYRKDIYSVSDRNAAGQFVVVRMSADKQDIKGAKIIPAATELHAEKLIRLYPWNSFNNLPDDPQQAVNAKLKIQANTFIK